MPPVGFEPTISAGERPKTYALDRAATGIGVYYNEIQKKERNTLRSCHSVILRSTKTHYPTLSKVAFFSTMPHQILSPYFA